MWWTWITVMALIRLKGTRKLFLFLLFAIWLTVLTRSRDFLHHLHSHSAGSISLLSGPQMERLCVFFSWSFQRSAPLELLSSSRCPCSTSCTFTSHPASVFISITCSLFHTFIFFPSLPHHGRSSFADVSIKMQSDDIRRTHQSWLCICNILRELV